MRIKKTSQTTPTQGQFVNGYSTSVLDGYTCNYMNGKLEKNVITCQLETTDNFDNGETIILNNTLSVGTKLTNSNGNIKIGTGVSKVLISAQIYINYSASNSKVYGFGILNGNDEINTTRVQKSIGQPLTVSSGTIMANVQENDEISMVFVTDSSNVPIVNTKTFLTVEVIE